MNKFLTISLAFLIIFGSLLPKGNIAELNKIPDLIEHYQFHKKNNPDFNFIGFVFLHYSPFSNHLTKHQHHNIPFQGIFISFLYILNQIVINLFHFNYLPENKTDFGNILYDFLALPHIFHPPK